MKKSQVKFSPKSLERKIFKSLSEEQTNRFVAYAEETIRRIGDTIQTYHSRNHMDRTGNLINSLCWGVAYNGELKASGFYREASSIKESLLHEWGEYKNTFYVDGHAEAENYIKKYGAQGSGSGYWRVFFAILAPYWGYWEKGFKFKGVHGEQFLQFAVMTQEYDVIAKELKPAKTYFKVTKSIEYSPSYDWTDKKGKSHHVVGTLERWNENGLYQSRRNRRSRKH